MFKLEYTESTGLGYRHRAWTRAGEIQRQPSVLQNQFALSEFELAEGEAKALYRQWLWKEMQDHYNVVWREMRRLVRAHQRGEEVEILVPKGAPHGEVIVRALQWVAENGDVPDTPPIAGSEPASCDQYSPDGVLNVSSDIPPEKIVWITGRTQSRMGVIYEAGKALVPEYGLVPLKNFRWVNRRLATGTQLQQRLIEEIDKSFEGEADATPVEYESAPEYNTLDRYEEGEEDFWDKPIGDEIAGEGGVYERDVLTLAERLLDETDIETALEIADMPEPEEEWSYRGPIACTQAPMIRPVYRYNQKEGDNGLLEVKSVADQLARRPFRYANREEAQEYVRTYRQSKSKL